MKRIAFLMLAGGVIAVLLASSADTALASSAQAKSQSTPLTARGHDDLPPYISITCVRDGDGNDVASLYLGINTLYGVTATAYASGRMLHFVSTDLLPPSSILSNNFLPLEDADNYVVFTWVPSREDYPEAGDMTVECPGGD